MARTNVTPRSRGRVGSTYNNIPNFAFEEVKNYKQFIHPHSLMIRDLDTKRFRIFKPFIIQGSV